MDPQWPRFLVVDLVPSVDGGLSRLDSLSKYMTNIDRSVIIGFKPISEIYWGAMFRFLFILSILTLELQAASIKDKNYGDFTVSEVASIYDWDTFRANIKGLHSLIGERIGIRVAGVDTPEIRGKCKKERELALKAKNITVEVLRSAKVIELRNAKRGKYFRIIADVFVDDKKLSDILIASDLAVLYDGDTKARDWCL